MIIADRNDIRVVRDKDGIRKIAKSVVGRREIANEYRFLEALKDEGVAAKPLALDKDSLLMEDLGETNSKPEPIECIRFLLVLQDYKVRHGDLTGRNLIVRNGRPYAVDFAQSRFLGERTKDKRQEPDAFHFWKAMASLTENRDINRWAVIFSECGVVESLVDLGCWEGNISAMALASGIPVVTGVDHDMYALDVARERWGDKIQFESGNITKVFTEAHPSKRPYSVGLLLSVWPYLGEPGKDWLRRYVAGGAVRTLFFETQLYGDGPGPDYFQRDADVDRFLRSLGPRSVERVATLRVPGRDASRSIWKITCV